MRRVTMSLVAFACFVCGFAAAQEPIQPGPEHAKLKQLEGTWDAVVKAGDMESKATATYKMELGGLWLVSDFEGEIAGQKFKGKGLDSYDANKKKYVSVWADSWTTTPLVTEGTFDKDGKVQTMIGEMPGPDGKLAKAKMVTEHKDKDTMNWTLYGPGPDGKEAPMFSISYKRRK